MSPGDFVFLLSIGNILSPYNKGQKKELSTDRGPQSFGSPRDSPQSFGRQQPICFRLVADCVSLRMAPDACAAALRAPHGWMHVQDTCRKPPILPDVRLHD
ncbi:hypothetical protein F2Q70_00036048 [Brassica cretica]|uniref:Uncharacterized protein n=1 Tax=Brassica cretica TaxID=69181 RepID=A0A8S9JQM2_BRACR|nr:hypothetical protein F2Q70_00036048 [Brassica cretica]